MKRIILLLLIMVSVSAASAQQWGGGIAVRMDNSAKAAVESVNLNKLNKVTGYRVCIFMDNGQSARENANRALRKFNENFSGAKAEVVYENPFFKVYVGRFITRNEAYGLLGKVSALYPRSVISAETFDIALFEDVMAIEDVDAHSFDEPQEIEDEVQL